MRYFLSILCVLTLSVPVLAQSKSRVVVAQTKPTQAYDANYPLDLEKAGLKLPVTSDHELQSMLSSENTIFYKLPQVWQHYVPASKIESNNLTLGTKSYHTTPMIYSIYSTEVSPEYHANGNFPWETTVGLNSSHKDPDSPYKTFNFIHLPGEEGKPKPILILSEYPIKWIYPPETVVGEVLYVNHDGKNYIQEIRTRKKSLDSHTWNPGLYRPIETREEFERVTGLKDYVAPKKYFHFRNPQETEVFMMSGLVERLPKLPEDKVKEILSMPFKKFQVDKEVWSPASDQTFSILPKDYCFSLLAVDSFTCASCHQQAQISVRNLTPFDPDVIEFPDLIGNIRGCDAVFTWYPFSERAIRYSKDDEAKRPSLRKHDLENKFIAFEDEIDVSEYKFTKYAQVALKPYELPDKKYLHVIESDNE